jgi:FAD/FMN-containing dehydrogenase
MWIDAYDAVTTRGGRYVQGGGCTTVGVAGLVQSGGFGNFSKNYGTAAAGLLEAEVVTADGKVRVANACTNPDLFWALKGGGGGSFGVITRLTLRTAVFRSTRHWRVAFHFNKGLAGAPAAEIDAARNTAMNPAVLDAFALAIVAGGSGPRYPGMPGAAPDPVRERERAGQIGNAMDELLKAAPDAGSYMSESDYFLPQWQKAFWGNNHVRLAQLKQKYDPEGLFFTHHGVGSEMWSDDRFTRRQG